MNLIARAEQCSRGLKCKLEKKKIHPDVIQSVLDHMIELDLVNDRRFAELWLKGKINNGTRGPYMLMLLLRARGIDQNTAKAALATALTQETEKDLLQRNLEKKAFKNSTNPKTAIRLFLKKQGFSADVINQYFEELN
ncbi:MAG: RecX family transcriptional regulator [Treponema sp.]|nr:RecX family transcriptional regulator [Treponema sp.]